MIEKQEPFKNRFIKAMDIRGMRCVDICKKTGIRDSTISQYRSGYAEPKADKLQLISEALKVNPVWLMGMDVPMEIEAPRTKENADVLANIMRNKELMEYVNKITLLSQDKKEALYKYIDFLLSTN